MHTRFCEGFESIKWLVLQKISVRFRFVLFNIGNFAFNDLQKYFLIFKFVVNCFDQNFQYWLMNAIKKTNNLVVF